MRTHEFAVEIHAHTTPMPHPRDMVETSIAMIQVDVRVHIDHNPFGSVKEPMCIHRKSLVMVEEVSVQHGPIIILVIAQVRFARKPNPAFDCKIMETPTF